MTRVNFNYGKIDLSMVEEVPNYGKSIPVAHILSFTRHVCETSQYVSDKSHIIKGMVDLYERAYGLASIESVNNLLDFHEKLPLISADFEKVSSVLESYIVHGTPALYNMKDVFVTAQNGYGVSSRALFKLIDDYNNQLDIFYAYCEHLETMFMKASNVEHIKSSGNYKIILNPTSFVSDNDVHNNVLYDIICYRERSEDSILEYITIKLDNDLRIATKRMEFGVPEGKPNMRFMDEEKRAIIKDHYPEMFI